MTPLQYIAAAVAVCWLLLRVREHFRPVGRAIAIPHEHLFLCARCRQAIPVRSVKPCDVVHDPDPSKGT